MSHSSSFRLAMRIPFPSPLPQGAQAGRGYPEFRRTSVAARCASGCDDLVILHGGSDSFGDLGVERGAQLGQVEVAVDAAELRRDPSSAPAIGGRTVHCRMDRPCPESGEHATARGDKASGRRSCLMNYGAPLRREFSWPTSSTGSSSGWSTPGSYPEPHDDPGSAGPATVHPGRLHVIQHPRLRTPQAWTVQARNTTWCPDEPRSS
jgi:hypothetical protein